MAQRSRVVIDIGAIEHNIRQVRNYIMPQTEIMAVVKADGYGHGAEACAHAAVNNGVRYLGVATTGEGVALRENGIKTYILVLGAAFSDCAEACVCHDLAQTVFDLDMARKINAFAQKYNKKAAVHIKLDSGMNRIGFIPCEHSINAIKQINALPNLKIDGIYSHFAESDIADKSFSVGQAQIFADFCRTLDGEGVRIPLKHMSNSAAVLSLPQFQFNMVRPGLILYGLPPCGEEKAEGFLPALSYKSVVAFVKDVPKGRGIGYNRTYFTKKRTVVATIPIGYADAYPRGLSNNGYVIIRGRIARIIGNICMDQMMVDVTDIEGVQSGDEVVLIGRQVFDGIEAEISAKDIAGLLNTISYEIICAVGNGIRNEKIYISRDEIL